MSNLHQMSGKYVIAGIGQTAFGKLPGRSTISLNIEACKNALIDAGVEKNQVDALLVKTPTSAREFMYGQKLAAAMDMRPKIGGSWDQGGAANIALISNAMNAIEAGQCEIALVCYADNPKTGNRDHFSRPRGDDAVFGWFSTAAGYAMIQQRHIIEFGTKAEDFGIIAKAARRHGAENPNAQLRKAIDIDSYLQSPMQIEPLRRDDCCLVSDGGAALVIMSATKARKLGIHHAIPILGLGQGQTSSDLTNRPSLTSTEAVVSGKTAFTMAGLKTKDIDVVQIYDCFTIAVMMTLEDYGFCPKGQFGSWAANGYLEIDGGLPFNTSGGLLSETGMPGLQLILEGVKQMRGTALLQVAQAKKCLISNQGGTMHTHGTLILGN
jgi:acetyl-CoA acetyltransferase